MSQVQEKAKDPLIGREVKDYRFVGKLGGGAFGAVYRAEHVRLSGRSVAIKVLHPHIATDEGIVERFRREARSLASFNHPNIVQIIDFDWHDEIGFYLVLEWINGDALNKVLKTQKRLDVEVVIDLFSQMLSGLAEAHSKGIVHRDLKPANLMIVEAGASRVLKVLDFGIASLSDSEHDLTTDGTAMGSANYMSPEQALGQIKKIDNRSDLYSCGIIMGKCLTGKNVYAADSPTQILWKHIYEPPPLLSSLYPAGNFSKALEDVFAKSIAKEKDARFQSAEEFLEALQQAAASEPAYSSLVEEADDDDDRTMFDPDYQTGVLLNADQPPSATVNASSASAVSQPSHTTGDVSQVIRGTAVVSGGVVARPIAAQEAARPGGAAQVSRPPTQGGTAVAVAATARPMVGAQSARQPGRHTIATAGSSMVRTPGESTGLSRLGGVPPEIREASGESSSSFSSSSIRPERPRAGSATRARIARPIRSPMKEPPPEPTFWEQYRWWVIGGVFGALAILASAFAVVSMMKPSKPTVRRPVDEDGKKAGDIFNRLDPSLNKKK